MSFLAQLVERVTSNDEVSRSSRLEGISESGIDNVFPSPNTIGVNQPSKTL